MSKIIRNLHVFAISPRSVNGRLKAGNFSFPCSLGRSGIKTLKREGDGATPRGSWQLRYGLTRLRSLKSPLVIKPLRRNMGWCDEPDHPRYNQPVETPFPQSHEELWRNDHLYDVVIVLDHNTRPRRRYGGSAVFFHLTNGRPGPTAGCIAISIEDMRKLLPYLRQGTRLVVH